LYDFRVPAFQEDLALASRCAGNDPEAWRALVDLVGPRIQGLARRLLRTADETRVEDAMAEAFAHFFVGKGRVFRNYRGESSLATYLCVVAERFLWKRARPLRELPWSDSLLERAAGAASPPGEEEGSEERLRALRKALEDLPPRDRELLALLYEGGLTHREAAKRLGIPLGTVATWAARARSRLARKIGEI
jgi:RNA polymerase sigma-70 factor (ECF subfamily)